jgi:DNA-binding beta-propeller fold protein YncE
MAAASVASAQASAAPPTTEIPEPEVISLPDGEAGIGGDGFLFATDRGTKELKVVDLTKKMVVTSTKLSGGPDYVRFVAGAHEVWVTEPSKKRVEIFKFDPTAPGKLAAGGVVSFPDGPESLVIDARRGRAYTHSWSDETYAVDLKKRAVVVTWKNGCSGAWGGALDEERGFLFVGCGEGKIAVIDVATGKTLSSLKAGSGIDSIGYSAALGHLYVPGGDSADLTVLAVSPKGELTPLGKVATGEDAHTVAIDAARSNLFVGSPAHGRVLVIHDPFPGDRPRDAR